MKKLLTTLILVVISITSIAQYTLKGKIVDKETGAPLPFVNIVYNEEGQGLTTNIDGIFIIDTSTPISKLKVSYVGYKQTMAEVTTNDYHKQMVIGLSPLAYSIEEVVIKPGVNPAHRVIKEVYRNRDLNNPEKLPHFRYYSYNKMYFTLEKDSSALESSDTTNIKSSKHQADSLDKKIQKFKEKQHVFMMEAVTERNFKHPNNNSEKVLASRVSGLKDPFFVFLSTQFQSFSFYPEHIYLGGKNHLNPISRGSTKRYLFVLEDTLFTQSYDSLFVISFRPLRNQNFRALKGVMTINSNGYAIQNVIAEPVEPPTPMFTLKIQQRYELIDSTMWFPVELNTDIYMRMANAQAHDTATGKKIPIDILGVGNTYIKNIDLNTSQRLRDFSHIELTFAPMAGEQDEEFWMQFRNDSLTQQELNTYHVIDSLGEAINLDRQMRIFESLLTGRVPMGYFNIDLNKIMAYNRFEGYRLGVGLETNNRLAKWLTLGGNYAYGFKDKEHKYGGFGKITLNQRHQVNIEGEYQYDVREPGKLQYDKPFGLFDTEQFRNYSIWRMDYVEKYYGKFHFRALKNFTISLSASNSNFDVASGYGVNHSSIANPYEFSTTEIGVEVKYVTGEKFMETPRGLIPMGFQHPIVWLKYYKGLPEYGGNFDYSRWEFRLDHQIDYRVAGKTSITLMGGLLDGDTPTPLLQFAPGNMDKLPFDASRSFAAMELYEFVSDRYAYAFIRHDFESLFGKSNSKFFKPQLSLVQNIGYGIYNDAPLHIFPDNSKDLSEGYYESGLLINGILWNPTYSMGIGAYYRWGSYARSNWEDNIALKITLSTNF
ncbi:MAG: DUF5686 family protein [Bacteroidales bacterium]